MKFKIIIIILGFTVSLSAESVHSGNSTSVNADSSFNALRNPALMSHQQRENFTSVFLYSYLANSDAEAEFSSGSASAEVDPEISEDFNAAFIFSDVAHSGRSSYGFGINKTNDGQIFSGSTELEGPGFSSREEKNYIGSTVMLSYSYKLNSTESVGMQIETAAFSETKETRERGSTDEKNLKVDKKRVTTGATLGYYLLQNNMEFGFMFKTGRYGYENQKYELELNGIKSDNKISNYLINDSGPGILFGFALRPERRFQVNMEIGYLVPYSHEVKSCDDDTLDELSGKVNVKYGYAVKGGLNYQYSKYFNFGIGGGYTRVNNYSTDEDGIKNGNTIYSIYQINSGIDIRPSENYALLFGLTYSRVMLDIGLEDSSVEYDLGVTEDFIDITAGISRFY